MKEEKVAAVRPANLRGSCCGFSDSARALLAALPYGIEFDGPGLMTAQRHGSRFRVYIKSIEVSPVALRLMATDNPTAPRPFGHAVETLNGHKAV